MLTKRDESLFVVVTGDIIGSTRLSGKARRRLLQVMKAGSKDVRIAFGRSVPFEVDVFRGDSWQLLITQPRDCLDVALYYRCLIRAGMGPLRVDTRLSIAIGDVDLMPGDRVSQGDGEAYRLSGRGLEGLKGHQRMIFSFPSRLEDEGLRAIRALVLLIDALFVRWTPKQAEAVKWVLKGVRQEEIAANWPTGPISQQAVAQHLTKAGWYNLSKGLEYARNVLSRLQPLPL